MNQFLFGKMITSTAIVLLVKMIISTAIVTHNPRISAQTVANRLREIGKRPHVFYMRRLLFGLVYLIHTYILYKLPWTISVQILSDIFC